MKQRQLGRHGLHVSTIGLAGYGAKLSWTPPPFCDKVIPYTGVWRSW